MTEKDSLGDSKQFHRFFSADRPIGSANDDRLGRDRFAEAIARAIVGWKHKDSLVISLYGPWGIGKSSIKNMVVQTLKSGQRNEAIVAEFNPWQFANRDQLLEAFFDQVGIALGRGDEASKRARSELLKRWQRYGAYLKASKNAVDLLRPYGVGAMIIGGMLFGIPRLSTAGYIVNTVLIAAGAMLTFWSKAAEVVADFLKIGTDIGKKTIEETKVAVGESLRKLDRPVVIVVDDVDRLTPAETIQLLQIIKANVDLPNVVFLLLCDRAVVSKHIESSLNLSGSEFLEKIVQIGFDVPAIERSRMLKVLTDGLNEIINADEFLEKTFDEGRWGNIFIGGLDQYFENLRDVNRYLSTLAFHVSLFQGKLSYQVNVTDLIALEVLRTFEPALYAELVRHKQDLTTAFRFGDKKDKDKQAVLALLELVEPSHRDAVTQMLKHLFPPAEWAFGGSNYGSDFKETWERQLRVCADELFDRYFHFAIPAGDVSQDVIAQVLALAGDKEGLFEELERLRMAGQLDQVLDRLEPYKQLVEVNKAVPFVTALFDIGDKVSDEMNGFFSISPIMHLVRIAYWCLKADKDIGHRGQLALEALRDTIGLRAPVRFIGIEEQAAEKKNENTDDRLMTDADLSAAKALLVPRIQAAAASGKLMELPEPLMILYRWRAWESEDAPRKFITELAASRSGALNVLEMFVQRSLRSGFGDSGDRISWFVNLENLEHFVGADVIEERLAGIDDTTLTLTEKRAVDAFRKSVANKKAGKGNDLFDRD